MKFKARLMTQQDVDRVLVRLAHQIVEKNHGTEGLCLKDPGHTPCEEARQKHRGYRGQRDTRR